MVDPEEIGKVRFTATRLGSGYDQTEVDDFLDRVADSLRQALQGKARAEADAAALRRSLDAQQTVSLPVVPPAPSQAATRLLEAAQATADECVKRAQTEAAGIIAQATADADKRRRAAEVDADRAQERAAQVKAVADSARATLDDQLSALRKQLGES